MTSLEQFFDACTLNYVNYFHRVPVAWWKSVHELHTVDDLGYAWRASPDGDGALMEEVSEYCRGDLEGEGQFPGPQCMPLRRLDTSTVCDPSSSYTFTEKSDGLRMIWMFRESSSFPVWKGLQELMGDDTADEQRNINDIMELEWGRYQLAATTGAPHVTITVMGRQLSMMSTDKSSAENAFRIRVEEGNTEVVLERTLGPRVLGYCFDRSLDAVHVALEVAPLACSFVSAVLDGELLVATKDSAEHLLFGAFDLLSTQRRSEQLQWYSRDSLSTRYAHLQMLLPTTSIKSNVFGVMWFVKEMFPLSCDGMTQCLDKLELSESDGSLWFERLGGFRSKNDGLVFSPNNFPIQRGSCASQFKWKWQQHLSVDFLLAPPKDAKTSGVVSYHASLFFLKRSLTFDGKKGLATHWPLIRPVRLANPHCLTLQQSQVVECTFDATQRCWSMEKLRPDKVSANSIRTAISVYEALAENVSLPRLLALLGVSDAATDAHATRLTGVTHNAITAPPVKPILDKRRASVKLMLRVVKNANSSVLRLQWCTNTKHPERPRSIVSSLCDVSQCFGLSFGPAAGADGTSSLVDLLSIELANNGGSYAWSDFTVEACFRPDVGRWEIMDLTQNDGAKNSATFDGVLSHLEYILDGQQPKVASTRPPFGVPSRKLGKLLTTSLDETKSTNAHYAEKTALLSDDIRSSRSNLRNFNNILKSWLISTSITRVCEEVKIKSSDLRILDLCCGRGGDLHKWKAVSPAFVLMIDSSMESVAEAARRYSSQEGMSTKVLRSDTRGFPARFCVEDVFDHNGSFKDNLHKMTVNAALHVVSCQFSIHYGFASTERVHFVMDAISAALAPGGLFIGTTVSDEALMERAKKEGKDFGNAAYRVSFASSSDVETMVHSGRASFGVKYYATVQHSVSDLAEYVVPWSEFVQICSARKLTLVSDELFQGVYDRNVATDEWQSITNVIVGRKRSRGGGAAAAQIDLSEDEWEAARLYRAFVFQKAL